MDKKFAQIVGEYDVRVAATVIVIGSHNPTIGIQNNNSRDLPELYKNQSARIQGLI